MKKIRDGLEEVHDKLVVMRDGIKAKYDALYEEEASHINNMIGECYIEVPDPVEEPVEEEPIVEENTNE